MTKRNQAQRKMYPTCSIRMLPNDLLMQIFRWLPQYAMLPATQVCSRWNSLICRSELLDNFMLRINPSMEEEDVCLEYGYYLSRSVRRYRKLMIMIQDQRSFMVAVLALRKFGQHLNELSLTLDQCLVPTYLQMHYGRMKEIEMGLEEYDRMLWDQEVDSYDRCLLPIAQHPKDEKPDLDDEEVDYRRIEEVFLAFTYRYCFRLEKLTIRHIKNYKDTRTKVLLYEGNEMEHLKELEIYGTGFIVLADSTSLRKLTVDGVTSGLPFYRGFRYAFPLLTHLDISNDMQFDNASLWAISKRCPQLEELTFVSDRITRHGFYYIHRLQQLKKLSITLQGKQPECTFDGCQALPVENLFISSHELRVETIQEMLAKNVNLKEFVVRTMRRIEYNMLNLLHQIRPACQLTYLQMTTAV
ncbi:uncharacterized protein LOC135697250 [Ochlerotatus camptorhynchus]|uniref:uncharacterized protein LOC135697250 n=1 Tax=Ochlerotatus camptorhynchus TaxID=644619 RepID=UPI0031D2F96F